MLEVGAQQLPRAQHRVVPRHTIHEADLKRSTKYLAPMDGSSTNVSYSAYGGRWGSVSVQMSHVCPHLERRLGIECMGARQQIEGLLAPHQLAAEMRHS
jgi:hypothetical protein